MLNANRDLWPKMEALKVIVSHMTKTVSKEIAFMPRSLNFKLAASVLSHNLFRVGAATNTKLELKAPETLTFLHCSCLSRMAYQFAALATAQ